MVDDKLKSIARKIGQEMDIDPSIIESVYDAYWKYIRDYIQSLDLHEGLTEEEFNALLTSFNIPELGKLCCTRDRYERVYKKFEYGKAKGKLNNIGEEHGN